MSRAPDQFDAVELQGLAWIDRMLSGEATTADLEDMRHWRALSPRHADALAYAARLRRAVVGAAPGFAQESRPGLVQALDRQASRRALLGGALAASVAGYMVVKPPMGLWPSLPEIFADYRTGVGEQRSVAIRSGVALDLNTHTSVALRSSGGQKQAELLSGETMATVKVPDDRPFMLTAGNGQIAARQASFDVKISDDGVSVVCVGGQAHVSCGPHGVALSGGQRVDYSARGLGPVAAVAASVATAWREGLIIFHDQPLGAVIENVNRYRTAKIVVVDAALGRTRMSGSLHLDRLDEIVAQVRLTGARVTSLPGGIVLLG
jgi:transmembrane sensor